MSTTLQRRSWPEQRAQEMAQHPGVYEGYKAFLRAVAAGEPYDEDRPMIEITALSDIPVFVSEDEEVSFGACTSSATSCGDRCRHHHGKSSRFLIGCGQMHDRIGRSLGKKSSPMAGYETPLCGGVFSLADGRRGRSPKDRD